RRRPRPRVRHRITSRGSTRGILSKPSRRRKPRHFFLSGWPRFERRLRRRNRFLGGGSEGAVEALFDSRAPALPAPSCSLGEAWGGPVAPPSEGYRSITMRSNVSA